MDAVNSAIDDLRSRVAVLNTVCSGSRGNENSAPKGSLIKMDATTDAIFKLQTKVDHLAERLRHHDSSAGSPNSNASSTANDVENLMIQMDEVRKKIALLERTLVSHEHWLVTELRLTLAVQGTQAEMQHYMDEVATAHKLRLETMFYQLTKEYEGRCAPGEVEFGLEEDDLFKLRQRILERLSIEDGVQCEFVRLKESQQMYS